MANQENLITPASNDHSQDERVEHETRIIEGDTYPISDNESTPDSVNLFDTNIVKLQGDFDDL